MDPELSSSQRDEKHVYYHSVTSTPNKTKIFVVEVPESDQDILASLEVCRRTLDDSALVPDLHRVQSTGLYLSF